MLLCAASFRPSRVSLSLSLSLSLNLSNSAAGKRADGARDVARILGAGYDRVALDENE